MWRTTGRSASTCADLAHLEYLPSGNTALTRRATKHSPLRAVVVQWAYARKRYERQGILVTADALRRAEEECLADEERRARQRERAAARREEEDQEYQSAVTEKLKELFPRLSGGGSRAYRGVDLPEAFRPGGTFGGGKRV